MAAAALINIDVSDLEAARVFYTAAFGLQVGRRLGPAALELNGAGVAIYLLETKQGSPATPDHEPRRFTRHWTPVHLDFVVDNLEAGVATAVAAGALQETEVAAHNWGKIARFAGPFGNGFCIIEFSSRGYDALVASCGRS
jgi:catechol 2,3-dioxygenase-like lactoylglutathione lyase family enzyme